MREEKKKPSQEMLQQLFQSSEIASIRQKKALAFIVRAVLLGSDFSVDLISEIHQIITTDTSTAYKSTEKKNSHDQVQVIEKKIESEAITNRIFTELRNVIESYDEAKIKIMDNFRIKTFSTSFQDKKLDPLMTSILTRSFLATGTFLPEKIPDTMRSSSDNIIKIYEEVQEEIIQLIVKTSKEISEHNIFSNTNHGMMISCMLNFLLLKENIGFCFGNHQQLTLTDYDAVKQYTQYFSPYHVSQEKVELCIELIAVLDSKIHPQKVNNDFELFMFQWKQMQPLVELAIVKHPRSCPRERLFPTILPENKILLHDLGNYLQQEKKRNQFPRLISLPIHDEKEGEWICLMIHVNSNNQLSSIYLTNLKDFITKNTIMNLFRQLKIAYENFAGTSEGIIERYVDETPGYSILPIAHKLCLNLSKMMLRIYFGETYTQITHDFSYKEFVKSPQEILQSLFTTTPKTVDRSIINAQKKAFAFILRAVLLRIDLSVNLIIEIYRIITSTNTDGIRVKPRGNKIDTRMDSEGIAEILEAIRIEKNKFPRLHGTRIGPYKDNEDDLDPEREIHFNSLQGIQGDKSNDDFAKEIYQTIQEDLQKEKFWGIFYPTISSENTDIGMRMALFSIINDYHTEKKDQSIFHIVKTIQRFLRLQPFDEANYSVLVSCILNFLLLSKNIGIYFSPNSGQFILDGFSESIYLVFRNLHAIENDRDPKIKIKLCIELLGLIENEIYTSERTTSHSTTNLSLPTHLKQFIFNDTDIQFNYKNLKFQWQQMLPIIQFAITKHPGTCPPEQLLPIILPDSTIPLHRVTNYLKQEKNKKQHTRLIALPVYLENSSWICLLLFLNSNNKLCSVCMMDTEKKDIPQQIISDLFKQLKAAYVDFTRSIEQYSDETLGYTALPILHQLCLNFSNMTLRAYLGKHHTQITHKMTHQNNQEAIARLESKSWFRLNR